MEEIRKQLLLVRDKLESKYETIDKIMERLKGEGKSLEKVEEEILKMNRIQGASDSIDTALRMLRE